MMDAEALKKRTKAYALRIVHLVEALPKGRTAAVIGRQLLRSRMSVGANYRAACRARSRAEFIAKMGIVEEEADETLYWIEIFVEAGLVSEKRIASLKQEGEEILSIVVSSIRTARRRKK